MTNLNYGVSVTPGTISELPWYISNWRINTADLVISDQSNHASELAYIKSLKLIPRIDIEMVIWAGGQIRNAISDYSGYLAGLSAAGWKQVCSEGGRPGDATYMKSKGLGYVNYNCDQCGLWSAGAHTDPGTVLNLWEAYYPSEVQYITQGAASGKPNGVLAGAWANSGGDNQILTNSLQGGSPSYKSIIDSLVAAGHSVTDFEVWGGENSNRSTNESLGFDTVVANLQKTYPPNGTTPVPPPPPATIKIVGSPALCTRDGKTIDYFVLGSDKATWHRHNKVWDSIGGVCTSPPAVVAGFKPGRIDVFVRGSDGALYQKVWDGTKWIQWKGLGGVILAGTTPSPTICNGALTAAVVGTNNALYTKTSTDGLTWSSWVQEASSTL